MKLAACRPVRAKVVTKAKAKAKTKRLAINTAAPNVMTDKEVDEAKKALQLLGYKAEMEANPKAKGDMVSVKGGKGAKGGGKGGKDGGPGGKVLKRPAGKGAKVRQGRDGPLVIAHGLEHVSLSPYDMVKFKAMMGSPENVQNVPPDMHAAWLALKKFKGNKGQHDAQDAIRRAWKLDGS